MTRNNTKHSEPNASPVGASHHPPSGTITSGQVDRATTDPVLRWNVLGDVSIDVDGSVRALGGQRQRAVLALLVLRAGTSVTVDELVEAIWAAEPPRTARNSIQRFVADIRRTLAEHADRLVTTAQGYRLDADRHEVDLHIAHSLHDAALQELDAGRPDIAARHCRNALALRRGAALSGVGDVWFRSAEAASIEELMTSIVETGFQADLALGRHDQIVDRLQRLVAQHPERETSAALLMTALYRSGRQQEALQVARSLRRRLTDEHGLTPSATITELERQILRHDPDLGAPASPDRSDRAGPVADVPLPSRLERQLTSPIVGRDPERAVLDGLIDTVAAGDLRVLFVHGEPGIGKTRLLSELAVRAQRAGLLPLYGRAADDADLPHAAWSAAFEHLARFAPELFDDPAVADLLDDLGYLVPEIRTMGSPTTRVRAEPAGVEFRELDAETRRAGLLRSVTRFLDRISEQQPVLVMLDDLQWAGSSTLQLLRHVVRHSNGSILLVGSHRDTDVGPTDPLSDLIGDLSSETIVTSLALSGIDSEASTALINSIAEPDDGLAAGAAASLHAATGGNPFFLIEVVNDLVEGHTSWDDAEQLPPVPNTVRAVIEQRVHRLGPEAASALSTASVCGAEFDLSVLAEATSIDERRLLDQLDGALGSALLAEHPRQNDRFVFSHDLVQHTLYEGLPRDRRRRLHADIGTAMSRRYELAFDIHAAEIVSHLRLAEDPSLDSEIVRVARIAAEHASSQLAPDEAVAWLEIALSHLDTPADEPGLSDDPGDGVERAELLTELGIAQRAAGIAAYRQTLLDAGRLAHRVGARQALVDAALANTRGTQTHVWEVDDERVWLLRAALDVVDPDDLAARADLLAGLASEQWDDEHRDDSAGLRRDSIVLARRAGDMSTLVNALARAARPRNADVPNDQAQALVDELHQFVDHVDELEAHLAVNLLRTIQGQALRVADANTTQAMSTAIHDLADRLPLPICVRASLLTHVLVAGLEGDHEAYERHAVAAFEHCVAMGDPEATLVFEAHLFYARHLAGRIGELAPIAAQLRAEHPDSTVYRSVAAIIASIVGDTPGAHHILDEVAPEIGPSHDLYEIQGTTFLAEAAARTDHSSVGALYDALALHGGQLAGQLQNLNWPMDLTLGSLATRLARFDTAEAHLRRALDISNRFDATWMRVQTEIRLADLLIQRGAEPVEAQPLLDRSVAVAHERGYEQLRREADAVLATT